MKTSRIIKRNSGDVSIPYSANQNNKTGHILRRHSFIPNHSKAQFFHGLLTLAQKHPNALSHQFQQDQIEKLTENMDLVNKNDGKNNPFLMAKAKLLIQKESESIKTSDSSVKQRGAFGGLMEQLQLNLPKTLAKQTVTWKQVNALQNTKKKAALKCLTDRAKKA